jgi:UDP-N-acetylmuramate: L-alanyl-gamma-D-glutamyl-meso-diaminopimelate ligase
MRMVPSAGLVITNQEEVNLDDVIEMGCWTPVESFNASASNTTQTGWSASYINPDGSEFDVLFDGETQGTVKWDLLGKHNVSNALAAIAGARHAGVPAEHAINALAEFKGIKRRMELRGEVNEVRVYDDFAHHPTAIETTLKGLRKNIGDKKITAILEPRSNTMRLGTHKKALANSLQGADQIFLFQPEGLGWDMNDVMVELGDKATLLSNIDELISAVIKDTKQGDQLLVMSNGGFGGIHDKLIDALKA